eukprot:scaffold3178_cov282-Pinguiococcus_pyrenoidosus.AAC.6
MDETLILEKERSSRNEISTVEAKSSEGMKSDALHRLGCFAHFFLFVGITCASFSSLDIR